MSKLMSIRFYKKDELYRRDIKVPDDFDPEEFEQINIGLPREGRNVNYVEEKRWEILKRVANRKYED